MGMGLAGILNLGARAYEAVGLDDLAAETAKLGMSEELNKKKVPAAETAVGPPLAKKLWMAKFSAVATPICGGLYTVC